jgi:hypothetical protein
MNASETHTPKMPLLIAGILSALSLCSCATVFSDLASWLDTHSRELALRGDVATGQIISTQVRYTDDPSEEAIVNDLARSDNYFRTRWQTCQNAGCLDEENKRYEEQFRFLEGCLAVVRNRLPAEEVPAIVQRASTQTELYVSSGALPVGSGYELKHYPSSS